MTFGHPETTGSKSIDHYLFKESYKSKHTKIFFRELLVMETMPMIFETN